MGLFWLAYFSESQSTNGVIKYGKSQAHAEQNITQEIPIIEKMAFAG